MGELTGELGELERITKEWEKEGLSHSEVEKNLQTLKKIYIGQNIRSEGILSSDFSESQVKNLLKKDLIRENYWYFKQYLTTERGAKVAQELLSNELEVKKDDVKTILDSIPKNLLGFLLFEYFAIELRFRVEPSKFIFDWRDVLLSDSRTLIARNKILKGLENLGLCVKTHHYVSTRGGELRDLYYVISPEIQEWLLTLKPELKSLDEHIKKKCLIFYFLTSRIPNLRKTSEIRSEEEINIVRQEYWNRLGSVSLTEENIKPIIDEMSRRGITTEYRGLFVRDLPFAIIDEVGYRIYLKRMLIDPVLSYLFGESYEQEIKDEQAIEERKEKVPPGIVSGKELLDFFDELGEFEMKVRDFIVSELGRDLKRCKNEKLIEKFRERKMEEEKLIGFSGSLVEYATIEEYIALILSSWDKFGKYFNDKEEVTIPLKLINICARRPLAHFRTLTKTRIDRAREEMVRFLEKIEK